MSWLKQESEEDGIVVSIWSKKVGRIDRMLCFKKEDGKFDHVVQQLH